MPARFRFLSLYAAFFVALVAVWSSSAAAAPQPTPPPLYINYKLAMPRPASHLFQVTVEPDLPTLADYVDFQMPRWSPGRYAVFDFAKNVQEVRAQSRCRSFDQNCEVKPLPVTRLDDQTWRVTTRGASCTLNYKVFGDDLSGTFAQLDARHANYNGGEIFMYVVGHKQDPVTLRIEAPAN